MTGKVDDQLVGRLQILQKPGKSFAAHLIFQILMKELKPDVIAAYHKK